MTIDANTTHSAENTNAAGTIAETSVGSVFLTAGATSVQIPTGEQVVRVQVTPGETVQLPFAAGPMLARLDDGSGNLAVKVGDVTVILQGYVAAMAEAPVTLLDASGAAIDIAAVLAATDPNLDIATAAGPAAGDQGTGVDNNGGLFTPFDPAGGIGGLTAVGGLGATQLQYGLIERVNERVEEDAAEVDTVPSLVGLTPGDVVNEDDLERQEISAKELDPAPQYVLDGLKNFLGGGTVDVDFSGPSEEGNDPFDNKDHEEGSQNNPPLPDANAGGVDQDREPLTSTAVASVNFFADLPGHLSFANGSVPVIDQLQAMGLTSHSQEIKYALLPGAPDTDPDPAIDNSHGETIVAYVEYQFEFDGQVYTEADVIFTIGVREFEGTSAISEFHIDFTIHGNIDNVPGIEDANGNILEALDIEVPFFMVDGNGSVTPAPEGTLTFTDIDDVPQFGYVVEAESEGGEEGEEGDTIESFGSGYLPQAIVPSDAGIVHDETDGEDSPDDEPLQDVQYQVGLALAAAGWANEVPLGVAKSWVTASFGADGRAGTWDDQTQSYVGNKEAGETAFTGDAAGTYSNAFQFYIAGAEGPMEGGLTNWTITVDGEVLNVLATQIDANTIKGYALDGDLEIPVFVLSIDPSVGEVILTQLHQVNHANTADSNDTTPPLHIYGAGEVPANNVIFSEEFNSLDGWSVVAGGNAAIVDDPDTATGQPNPSGAALLVSEGASDADVEAFFGLAAGALDGIADDGGAGNDPENATIGSAIRREIDVTAGDQLTVRFNFLDNEGDGLGAGDTTFQDFAFIVIGGEVIRLANIGEPGISYQGQIGSFSFSEESGYLTFHFTFATTDTVQIGFGVFNEGDEIANAGLLIDQIELTAGAPETSNIIVRATDYDGDTADLPYNVTIRDDGPSIVLTGYQNQVPPGEGVIDPANEGRVDEDWLVDGNSDKDSGTGDAAGGYKSVAIFDLDFGQDGPGTLFIDPATIAASGAVDGGLVRASDGAQIIFVPANNGATIIGYADADKSGLIEDAEKIQENEVLSISTVGNTIEFELFQALRHSTTSDKNAPYDGNVESDIIIGVNAIVTDADGDTAVAAVQFRINDDSVVAADDSLTVTGLQTAVSGGNLFDNDQIGADVPAKVQGITVGGFSFAFHDATDWVVPVLENGDVATNPLQATGFIKVYANGDWEFTQIKNTESAEPTPITFSYRVADADGDFDTGDVTITLKHYEPPRFEEEWAIVDEDGISGSEDDDDPEGQPSAYSGDDVGGHQVDGQPNPATEAVFRNTLGNSFTWNGDVGTMKFTFDNTQLAKLVLLDGTVPTLANVSGNGTDHVIVWAGTPEASEKVLEIKVIDLATAVYEVELHSPLKHDGHDNEDTKDKIETWYQDEIVVPVTVTAANNGGEHSAPLMIKIDDGFLGQWGWSSSGLTVDEDQLPSGNQDKDADGNSTAGEDSDLPSNGGASSSFTTGILSSEFLSDGPGATPYGIAGLAVGGAFGAAHWGVGDPLRTSAGLTLKVLSSSGSELVIADSSNQPVITFTVDQQSGAFKFEIHQALEHRGANEDSIKLKFDVVFMDGDGDSITMDMEFSINDDKPEAKDDQGLVMDALGTKQGSNLLANDLIGADGGGKVTKVTFNGQDYSTVNGGNVIAVTGGLLHVTEGGMWWFEQTDLVNQPTTLNFTYTVRDSDGDTDTASFSVQLATQPNVAPVASDDRVISLTTSLAIPEWALLRNDNDQNGDALDVVNIGSAYVGGTGGHNAGTGPTGHVFFNDTGSPSGANNGSFEYQASDGKAWSGDAEVVIDVQSGNNVNGSNDGEIILGNGNNNQLNGGGGNDIILGDQGQDRLNGGSGVDWLFGESGNDTLDYDPQDKFDGGTGNDALFYNTPGTDFDFVSRSDDDSHRMNSIEWVNLGDSNDGTGNTVSIALNDVLDANVAFVNGAVSSYQVDLFVVGDHEGAVRDGVDLAGFSRVDVNGGAGGFGTVSSTVVTGSMHAYQIWQGTNDKGQTITLAIEDGLTITS